MSAEPHETADPKLSALLALTAQHMRLVPLWHVIHGRCGCGNPKCTAQGKHPNGKLVPNGVTEATYHESQVIEWHAAAPVANWGVATGMRLVVIDVDRKNNVDGAESLRQLEEELGPLPHTLRANTPSGGYHLYFVTDVEIHNSVGKLGAGLDVRGEGGYVVCPPSITHQGSYQWDDEMPIERLPEEWVTAIQRVSKKKKSGTRQAAADAVIEGGRNEHLFKMGCYMRGKGLGAEAVLQMLLTENQTRCRPPLDEPEVKGIANSVAQYEAGQVVNPPTDSEGQPETDWKKHLAYTKAGIKGSIGNVLTILAHDPAWQGVIGFDEFRGAPVFLKPPPFAQDYGAGRGAGEIEDADDGRIATWLERNWKLSAGLNIIPNAVLTTSHGNRFHPVRDHLETLRWDGISRLSVWLTDYLGVRPTEISSAVGEWFMISAVARIYRPGCQVDHVPILEGDQGARKSTAIRVLFDPWFTDELPDLRNAQAVGLNLRNVWCVEIGELSALVAQSAETVKRVMSQRSDRYRLPYGRRAGEYPRQCVFVGTTNRDDYLSDPTGARRWWPVVVGDVDIEALTRDRDQIWAEAVALYKQGRPWWPQTEAQRRALAGETQLREAVDPWFSPILDFLSSPRALHLQSVTTSDMLTTLRIDSGRQGVREEQRVGTILRKLGWTRRQSRRENTREWRYFRPGDT